MLYTLFNEFSLNTRNTCIDFIMICLFLALRVACCTGTSTKTKTEKNGRLRSELKAPTLLCFGLVEVPVAQATRKARNHQIRLIMMKSVHVLLVKRKFVEKCVKQTSEKVLENPANYPSALLSCNWAGKPWSIGDRLSHNIWNSYLRNAANDRSRAKKSSQMTRL